MSPLIHIAFRFHGNFYHSYRGDSPDEFGFGKDIRIIRHIIKTLDELNGRGVPVQGTWDFENYFSLEKIMPVHCPDVIAGLQRRAQAGPDEFQLMSYNNGLVSAHTAREFEAAIRRGITNPEQSGLRDLFGDRFYPMVRPQEMMFTPIHLKLYPACGIDSLSLYYSALPFNGFSNFVPALSLIERYNPLTLAYPGLAETMTLVPCYSHGDIADHLTLRRWVKALRRQQLALENPCDLLLLIDMDADDAFWLGFDVPILSGRFSTIGGLRGLVENIVSLDYVVFTTPGNYLKSHAPVKTLVIGQDTADGSFDGMSSWAEKWSNHRLWTGLEIARILDLQTRRLATDTPPPAVQTLLDDAFEARLKLLSTTHFGMAAPVMNLTRERTASALVRRAVDAAAAAFAMTTWTPPAGSFSLVDYVRGELTGLVHYAARPSRGLVRLPLGAQAPGEFTLIDATGQAIPSAILDTGTRREICFTASFQPAERKDYRIEPALPATIKREGGSVSAGARRLQNEYIQLALDQDGQVTSLAIEGVEFAAGRFINSGLTYANKTLALDRWEHQETLSLGMLAANRMHGSFQLPGGELVRFEREILLAAGLPYLYLRLRVAYPLTPNHGEDRHRVHHLEQGWDSRWKEVNPCEISPAFAGSPQNPLRVWKHNFCDHVSQFDLDYARFSKNDELDSVNNQVTHGWLAVSNGSRGVLVAQTADVLSNMAFCPLRTRRQAGISRVSFNPFGSYSGRQYRYATADTGLGNLLATTFSASDHIQPYAPSYNGRTQEFSILIAPYVGDSPPTHIQQDAEAFAYPYLVVNDGHFIAAPAHRNWSSNGLGDTPTER